MLEYNSVLPCSSSQARLQRGNVLLKQGRLDEAHIDYEAVVCCFCIEKLQNDSYKRAYFGLNIR